MCSNKKERTNHKQGKNGIQGTGDRIPGMMEEERPGQQLSSPRQEQEGRGSGRATNKGKPRASRLIDVSHFREGFLFSKAFRNKLI